MQMCSFVRGSVLYFLSLYFKRPFLISVFGNTPFPQYWHILLCVMSLPCPTAIVADIPMIFLIVVTIVGGLYSVTTLRENDQERVTVYSKHQLKLHSQTTLTNDRDLKN